MPSPCGSETPAATADNRGEPRNCLLAADNSRTIIARIWGVGGKTYGCFHSKIQFADGGSAGIGVLQHLVEREGKREQIRGNMGIPVGIPQIEENSDGRFIGFVVETMMK